MQPLGVIQILLMPDGTMQFNLGGKAGEKNTFLSMMAIAQDELLSKFREQARPPVVPSAPLGVDLSKLRNGGK